MKTVIVGGGAAGLMCASLLCGSGQVVLLEKNEKTGKKLFITGKGRCNVTNDCDSEQFLENIVTGSKFMRGAAYAFPPEKTIQFFENNGLKLKTERGNRVFPLSDKSSDVIKCFNVYLREGGADVRLNTAVTDIIVKDGQAVAVRTEKQIIECDNVVVCTGGQSYPLTGSTGDGYLFAQKTGHSIEKIRPALVGLNLKGGFGDLSGLSLKNVGFTVFRGEKTVYSDFGEMLFTHTGISGPVVLSASSYISKSGCDGVSVCIDLKPALDLKKLDARVLRDFDKYKNKQLKNALVELLPKSLICPLIKKAGLDENKFVNNITAKERERLVYTLKNLCYEVASLRGIDEAIITGGGVSVKQINPKTMESKLVKNLYFAGEVIDVDALTGGFNLQCAFSTAYLAANAIKNSQSD